FEVQHMSVGREVAEAGEDGQGKIGRRHLEGETLADQSSEFGLVLEGVDAGEHAACAVVEKVYGKARLPRFHQGHEGGHIADVVLKVLDVETFAVRLSATTQIHRVYREAIGHELFGHPIVLTAVGVET